MKKVITLIFLVLLTSTSFAQWSEQSSGVTSILYSVSAIDNNTAWICGAAGKVLRTTNGGTNWVITASPNAVLALYNIWGVDANTAFVTGSSTMAYVYKTVNGGANWTQVFSQAGGFMNVILKVGVINTYAIIGDPVGGRWSLFVTENSGSSWDSTGLYIPQAGSETGYNNSGFAMISGMNEYGYFGTNNTRIYKGVNGDIWTSQPTPGQANSLAIVFPEEMIGFAGGSTGLLYTSNGGTIWSDLPGIPGSGSINGLAYGDVIGELFFSRGSSIYHTTSGGINWSIGTTQTGTYNHLIKARTGFNLWAIRNNGGISKYNYPIGIKPISSEVPNSFSLHQNYPNPFNPSTKIRFSLPHPSQGGEQEVKLIIYDALGREVATLVNEQLQPGTYEAEFNGADYPSGVYFYKLIAGNYVETKKMVLVK